MECYNILFISFYFLFLALVGPELRNKKTERKRKIRDLGNFRHKTHRLRASEGVYKNRFGRQLLLFCRCSARETEVINLVESYEAWMIEFRLILRYRYVFKKHTKHSFMSFTSFGNYRFMKIFYTLLSFS